MYRRIVLVGFLCLMLSLVSFNVSAKSSSTITTKLNQRYNASQLISHTIPLDIVFVGYNEEIMDMSTLDSIIVKYYEMPYVERIFSYQFDVNYIFANQSYGQALTLFALENSVIGMNTTSKLNVTALEYQRATGTKMSIFLPQSGRAINALAVEEWFAMHPYVSSTTPRYTFYVLNFTNFDSVDHSLEHWYNLTEREYDANSTKDFWRLEWDNPLNPDVCFPYPAFSSHYPLFFIDPSAFNWYLTWARIWWSLTPYLVDPKYAYYFEDLDTFQQTHDISTPDGQTALAYYLGGWIDDILSNSLAPSLWPMSTYSLALQVLVLNNASEYGYTNEKMGWILNTSLVEEAVQQLVPFIPTEVSVRFENLSDYPEIDDLVKTCVIHEENSWKYIDGLTLFYGLEDLREQHFDYNRAEIVVNGYVFLLKNASMVYGDDEFTGLGGDMQVMILKSVDRYFREDGVTPKSGLSMYMIHELGHNLGFPHTFANYDLYYAGDFAFDSMGYYPYSFYFSKLRTDLYRRTYADVTFAELQNALKIDQELYSGQNSSDLIDSLFNEINIRIAEASSLFGELEYLDALYVLFEAQCIEAYLRELVATIIPLGDVNHDGVTNIIDATRIGIAWFSIDGEPDYDFFVDLDSDGIIDIGDATVIGLNWLATGKVEASFFRWATGNRTTTFDYIANVWPDWAWTEKNMTYGYWNWGNESLQCSLRIRNITDIDNIASIYLKIFNTTTTILEITWNSGEPLPQDWSLFLVAAQSKYSIYLDVTYTDYAPTWYSRITFETKINPP